VHLVVYLIYGITMAWMDVVVRPPLYPDWMHRPFRQCTARHPPLHRAEQHDCAGARLIPEAWPQVQNSSHPLPGPPPGQSTASGATIASQPVPVGQPAPQNVPGSMSAPYTVHATQQNGYQNTADDLELVIDTTMPHASTYVAGSQRSASQAQAGSSAAGDDVRCYTPFILPCRNFVIDQLLVFATQEGCLPLMGWAVSALVCRSLVLVCHHGWLRIPWQLFSVVRLLPWHVSIFPKWSSHGEANSSSM
jgi:hypothetical protein